MLRHRARSGRHRLYSGRQCSGRATRHRAKESCRVEGRCLGISHGLAGSGPSRLMVFGSSTARREPKGERLRLPPPQGERRQRCEGWSSSRGASASRLTRPRSRREPLARGHCTRAGGKRRNRRIGCERAPRRSERRVRRFPSELQVEGAAGGATEPAAASRKHVHSGAGAEDTRRGGSCDEDACGTSQGGVAWRSERCVRGTLVTRAGCLPGWLLRGLAKHADESRSTAQVWREPQVESLRRHGR